MKLASRAAAWLLFAAAVPTLHAAGPACNYTSRSTIAAGRNPRDVVTGDLNGDGKLDLVATNLDANSISVALGNGDGTFRIALTYAVGRQPYQLILADLNGDRRPDIATSNFGGQDISLLLNNGDGTFAAAVTYTTGGAPRALVAGDFNGDSQIDLAVANSTANSVSSLLGAGDGTLSTRSTIAAGSNPHGILVADFNADGKLDLAIANAVNTGSVTILYGKGDGTFLVGPSAAAGARAYSLVTADFNRDGRPDIATANNGANSVSVLLSGADGGFVPAATYATPGTPVAIQTADVNGDGFPDLLAADLSGNSLDIFLGNGDGTFAAATALPGLSGTYDVAVGDYDGDGVPDLAVATSGSNNITVLHTSCPTAAPALASAGIVNAASAVPGIVSGAWVSLYGTSLATTTYTLQANDITASGALPVALQGVSVQINGKAAYPFYISPTQINVLAPEDSATGTVPVVIQTANGTSATSTAILQRVQPGLFASSGYALAVRYSDGLTTGSTTTIQPGDVLELFGTGLGPTTPAAPAGLLFSGAYPTTNPVTARIGGIEAPVSFSGLVGPGLYQVNVTVPLLTDGTYPVVISVAGVESRGNGALLNVQRR